MNRHFLQIKETIAWIICEEKYFAIAKNEIQKQRDIIEEYIKENPEFKTSLTPLPVKDDAPEIIKEMSIATSKALVGPMAAIAGAIAYHGLKSMIESGAEHAIIDNGGDLALYIKEPVTIGIFTGPAKIKNIGLKILPQDKIMGICTSSGSVGHSLSFGKADAAIVISDDPVLSDAFATRLCNSIQNKNEDEISAIMQNLLTDELKGMITIIDDIMVLCGDIPEIVKVKMDIDKISKI